ncbi:MAG: type II toxin-antitoxin system RelE/ParE family toxin, partial [Spirochaetaceae bacterium]|nr:type II toxin-antitoxin system RelE/ParE family toxin [Spirochaetaceae bacterium]
IEFDPLAVLELRDTVEYYNFKLMGLGDRFKEDVQKGISRIAEYPDAWQHQTSRTRRFVLNSFPYKIIYAIHKETITILAIANSHREPDYWVNRIEK